MHRDPLCGTPDRRRGLRARRPADLVPAAILCMTASACSGPRSALDPAGEGAERIADLFWWMAGGAAIVWVLVVGLAVYAIRVRPGKAHEERVTSWLIIGGGAALPTVVLAGLLAFGLAMLPELVEPAPAGSMRIAVSGEQWWWRVRYEPPEGAPVELANEIRLAVGEPVDLLLESPDVIHSFWVPALGGKMDMIPGRVTRLTLAPTRPGAYRGLCAEYCGASHALMAFDVVVVEPGELAGWLERQRRPAAAPAGPLERRGAELFLADGCGACHTVRGTPADGKVGPDLTHVGSRTSLGAGILPNEPWSFARWLSHTDEVKPGVHMPAFGMLPAGDVAALAAYLEGLE